MNPKPNEIWRTREDNLVMVVEHPMSEVKGKIGFVWYDGSSGTFNFSPLEDQLLVRTYLTIPEWVDTVFKDRG